MTEAGKVLFQQSVVTLALRLLAQSALTELAKVKGSQAEAWLDVSEQQVIHGVKSFVPTPNVPDDVFQQAVKMALAQVHAAFVEAREQLRGGQS